MVNASLNWSSLLGITLVILGLFLMVMRGRQSSQPSHSGQDLPLVVSYLIAGFILLFQGWQLDPILQFAQLLWLALLSTGLSKIFLPVPSLLGQRDRIGD